MHRQDLINYILKSNIIKKWHWFSYHFGFYLIEKEHEFAKNIVDTCLDCENYIPNFATDMIDSISILCGKPKYERHYDQLMERLSEILIVNQIVNYKWSKNIKFLYKPSEEIIIDLKDNKIGIDIIVKKDKDEYKALQNIDKKFETYKNKYNNFYGIVIVIKEDMSTENLDEEIYRYSNIDGLVVTDHLKQFIEATLGRKLSNNKKSVLDYGENYKKFITNKNLNMNKELLDSLRALQQEQEESSMAT